MFNSVKSKRSRLVMLISFFLAAVLVLAACAPQAGANPAATDTAAPVAPPAATDTVVPPTPTSVPPTATTAVATGVMINTSTNAALGTFLVDSKGMTLYVFTKDTPGVSACTSAGCLKAWPILEATGDPVAGTGVTGKLGVITRTDGKKQVTINDMPLYYYAPDKAPGDTTGHGVGNVWFVVDGTGKMITTGVAPSATPAAATATPAASSSGGVAVNSAANATFGTILVDSKGMTLYIFTKDTPGVSACTSAGCLKAWPILEATSDPVAGTGVTGKLGVITRTDGKKQVTINDMPLYYYAPDKGPGDTTGQDVGNVWYVVDASGKMITTAASSSGGVTVNTATKDGNTFLVDSKGMTLYVFTKDTPGVSACTSEGCLKSWPILEATGDPVAGTGVTGKLGVIVRSDGKKQVTINDMPLYYFASDKAAGDMAGQAVGNVWYIVDGSGKMITTAMASPTATTSGY